MNKINREGKIEYSILYDLFINQNKSGYEIADILGTTYGSVNYYLNKYQIRKNGIETLINKEELESLYNQNISLSEIAEHFSCCYATIERYIDFFGIKCRYRGIDNSYLKDTLEQMYINDKKSIGMISDELNLPKSRIRTAMVQNNIPRRNKSECQQIYNSEYKSFTNNWNLIDDKLIIRCRRYFQNHIAPLINKSICEECRIATENLHLHHMKALSIIIQEIRSENPYLNDDELFNIIINDYRFNDLSNIKVVCEYCHYTIYHPYAGYIVVPISFIENKTVNQQPSFVINKEGSTTIES